MRSIIRRQFWNTLQWSDHILVTSCDVSSCQWYVWKVILVSSKAYARSNSKKKKLYTCWYVYKQCQKQCRRFGQKRFYILHLYTIAATILANCISYKEKFARSIREKNVHFNIVSGHFEFMSTPNYGDYQPRFITPKLDFLRHRQYSGGRKELTMTCHPKIFTVSFSTEWNFDKCSPQGIPFISYFTLSHICYYSYGLNQIIRI